MKRTSYFIVSACLLLCIMLSPAAAIAQEAGKQEPPAISLQLNGVVQSLQPGPTLIEGTTMVPMRAIFEALGADVFWDEATRTVSAFKNKSRILLTIGRPDGWINGVKGSMPVAPYIKDGTTFVPARFVSESLGAEVSWSALTRTVLVETSPAGEQEQAVKSGHRTSSSALNDTLFVLPDPMPEIKEVNVLPYFFNSTREWSHFNTQYFRVYYYSHEQDVLKLSGHFDRVYQFLLDEFGMTPPESRIALFFHDEEGYAEEDPTGWSAAQWNGSNQTMIMMLQDDEPSTNNNTRSKSKKSAEEAAKREQTKYAELLSIFKHEMTHAMTTRTPESRLRAPIWYHEAAAGYYETREPFPMFDYSLYEAYKNDELIPLEEIPYVNLNWHMDEASVIYAQAQSFYMFLADQIGIERLNNLWFVRGEYRDVLKQITGKTFLQLEEEWLDSLAEKYEDYEDE